MKILAIETSCDETAVAIVEATGNLDNPKFEILAKAINSQIDIHKEFGGVYPTLAKREHSRNIVPVMKDVLNSYLSVIPGAVPGIQASINKSVDSRLRPALYDAGLLENDELFKILEREPDLYKATIKFLEEYERPDIDMIAVTSGPGLEPALWVGISFARALSIAWEIPLIDVNHMEGHITSVLLSQNPQKIENRNEKLESEKINFPALALLISGGHTELVEIEKWNKYKILGKTRDDAVGESYDKVARLLGFKYPGGPKISELAEKYRSQDIKSNFKFPRPMINSNNLEFSFSGLKTSVLYKIQELTNQNSVINEETKICIAGEFEEAVADVLVYKINSALKQNNFQTIIVAGGVTANKYLRFRISEIANQNNIRILFPDLNDSTDNAQMIACAGYLKSIKNTPKIGLEIKANGGLTY